MVEAHWSTAVCRQLLKVDEVTWKYNSSSAKHYSILPLYIRIRKSENIWTSVTHTGIYHNFYFIGHAPMYPQMQVKLVRSPDRGQLRARAIRHCIYHHVTHFRLFLWIPLQSTGIHHSLSVSNRSTSLFYLLIIEKIHFSCCKLSGF